MLLAGKQEKKKQAEGFRFGDLYFFAMANWVQPSRPLVQFQWPVGCCRGPCTFWASNLRCYQGRYLHAPGMTKQESDKVPVMFR